MKFSVLLDILFELLTKRRLTASYLAEKHKLSPRTIYRYVELLSHSVPVSVKRGRDGGICIPDSFKLPMGFMTEAEYGAAIEALSQAYARSPEERFLSARRKLSAQMKEERREQALSGDIGNFLIDSGGEKDETLRLIEEALREKTVLEIEYGEEDSRFASKIEPHVLVFKQNAWLVYAFCHTRREFCLFERAKITSASKTEETFRPRPFDKENISL